MVFRCPKSHFLHIKLVMYVIIMFIIYTLNSVFDSIIFATFKLQALSFSITLTKIELFFNGFKKIIIHINIHILMATVKLRKHISD